MAQALINTFLKVSAQLVNKVNSRLTTLADDCPYRILSKFLEITRIVDHTQTNHTRNGIETTGSSVSNKARRFYPEKLKAAKESLNK